MRKKRLALILSSVLASFACAGLFACGDETRPAEKPKAGGDLSVIDGVELDYDGAVFDGFDNGVDYDRWYIGKQAWGVSGDGNGGVVPENVNYTDDGKLVFTGNGSYYTAGEVRGVGSHKDGTLTGGALISKFKVRPGRFEIKMKVLPRLGACSAFWTFAYDDETRGNHEIDIEFPGGTHTGGVLGFDKVLNTNYWAEDQSVSKDTVLSDITGGAVSLASDGEWHTYGFDWYTSVPGQEEYVRIKVDKAGNVLGADGKPDGRTVDGDGYIVEDGERTDKLADADGYVYTLDKNNGKVRERNTDAGVVIYYVDGKITAINEELVPWYESRLWLGVWFPNNTGFVGDANFETDYMQVDYVNYIPFKNQTYHEFTPNVNGYAAQSEYPSKPVSLAEVNKVANGDFEYIENGAVNSGWKYGTHLYSDEDYEKARADYEVEYFTVVNPTAADEFIKGERPELNDDAAFEAFKQSAEYAGAVAAAKEAIKRTVEYRRGERLFIYPTDNPPVFAETAIGAGDTCGVRINDCGMLYQSIDSVYAGQYLNIAATVKGKGAVRIAFLQAEGSDPISEKIVALSDSDEWITHSAMNIAAPSGTRFIEIRFIAAYGKTLYADNVKIRM